MKHNYRILSILLLCQVTFFPGPWANNPSGASDLDTWNIIPFPVSITPGDGVFILESEADIYVNPGSDELNGIGQYLAGKLNPATGYDISVIAAENVPAYGNIYLALVTDSSLGSEGYRLSVTPGQVTLEAYQPAGLFRGIQTIRQVLPRPSTAH